MPAKKDLPNRYHLNRPDLAQAVAAELRTCLDVKSQQRLLDAAGRAANGALSDPIRMGLSPFDPGGGESKCGRVLAPAGSEPGDERVVSEPSGGERPRGGARRHLGSSRVSSPTRITRGAGAGASGGVTAGSPRIESAGSPRRRGEESDGQCAVGDEGRPGASHRGGTAPAVWRCRSRAEAGFPPLARRTSKRYRNRDQCNYRLNMVSGFRL